MATTMLPRKIATEIEIAASAEQVNHVLTDFERYEKWNPFMLSIKGEPRQGGRIQAAISPPGKKTDGLLPPYQTLRS